VARTSNNRVILVSDL